MATEDFDRRCSKSKEGSDNGLAIKNMAWSELQKRKVLADVKLQFRFLPVGSGAQIFQEVSPVSSG